MDLWLLLFRPSLAEKLGRNSRPTWDQLHKMLKKKEASNSEFLEKYENECFSRELQVRVKVPNQLACKQSIYHSFSGMLRIVGDIRYQTFPVHGINLLPASRECLLFRTSEIQGSRSKSGSIWRRSRRRQRSDSAVIAPAVTAVQAATRSLARRSERGRRTRNGSKRNRRR